MPNFDPPEKKTYIRESTGSPRGIWSVLKCGPLASADVALGMSQLAPTLVNGPMPGMRAQE